MLNFKSITMALYFLFIVFLLDSFVVSQNIFESPGHLPICPSTETEVPLQTFVVGAKPADRGEFPWLANLVVKRSTHYEICGGSLIDWV